MRWAAMATGPQRLLCDEMLAGLARWLRAAGHDVALAPAGVGDVIVLALAEAENRHLLTRDGRLATEAAGRVAVTRLTSGEVDEQAAELVRRVDLDWTAAPFTRCLRDNTLLRLAEPGEVATIPAASRALPGPVLACPACGRVYWPGSHVRRMAARLEQWRAIAPAHASPQA